MKKNRNYINQGMQSVAGTATGCILQKMTYAKAGIKGSFIHVLPTALIAQTRFSAQRTSLSSSIAIHMDFLLYKV